MMRLAIVFVAGFLALAADRVWGAEATTPWWAESLPEDATGFNCYGTLNYENGQFTQTQGFKFPEQAFAPFTHADVVCVQTGPSNGWYRQQFKRIHVNPGFVDPSTHALFCAPVGGEPCDASGTRLCAPKGAGQTSPCGTTTGPNGCAVCGKIVPTKER
jgi:hypothetical protein